MKLKEKECRKCPRCNEIHLDRKKTCPSCNIPTEKTLYYSRLRLERFAFIYTLSLIISVSLFFVVRWESAKVGPTYVVFLFFIVIPGLLMFIYHMVNEYLSDRGSVGKRTRKELSIFKEIFFQNNKPTEGDLPFSWPKYFKEALSFVGILLIFIFLGAGIMIVGKLFN